MLSRSRVGAVALLFAFLALLFPGTASAAPIGGLVITPGESVSEVPVRLATDKGCPAKANAYLAKMRGPGLPADGIVVVSNGEFGLSHSAGFEVHLAVTFKDFAADHNVTFKGRYEIALSCVDGFSMENFGDFVGSVDFPDANHYVGVGAAKGPAHATAPAVPVAPMPADGGGQAAPGAPGAPGQAAPQDQAGQPGAAAEPEPAASGGGAGQPFLYIAIGVVGAVVVLAGASALRRRKSTTRPASPAETPESDD